MTGVEFGFFGVHVHWLLDGGANVWAPTDSLLVELSDEVARRDMSTPPGNGAHGADRCDCCGDHMGPGRGGWCMLCSLARSAYLKGDA